MQYNKTGVSRLCTGPIENHNQNIDHWVANISINVRLGILPLNMQSKIGMSLVWVTPASFLINVFLVWWPQWVEYVLLQLCLVWGTPGAVTANPSENLLRLCLVLATGTPGVWNSLLVINVFGASSPPVSSILFITVFGFSDPHCVEYFLELCCVVAIPGALNTSYNCIWFHPRWVEYFI